MTERRHVLRAGFLLVAAIASSCGAKDAKSGAGAAGAPAVPVKVATAGTSDVPIEIRAIGTLESPSMVVIKPQIAGIVLDLPFEEGADVRKGDPLVLFDPRPFDAALHSAEADLARDTALAADAKQAAAQVAGALEKSAVSQRSSEQAQAAAAAADAVVAKDRATVENARLDVEYCTIRAPFDGRTGRTAVRRGSVVKANETELVTLAQIVPIRVSFAVPESQLPDIRKASAEHALEVEVQVPGSDARVQGALTFMDNKVETTSGTIALLATFPNADRSLWPGQFVQVVLRVGIDRSVVVVPTNAVQTGQQGSFVFVVGSDNTVEMRSVVVKRATSGGSILSKGLAAGDVVVTDGHLRLVPGSRVDAHQPAADAAR